MVFCCSIPSSVCTQVTTTVENVNIAVVSLCIASISCGQPILLSAFSCQLRLDDLCNFFSNACSLFAFWFTSPALLSLELHRCKPHAFYSGNSGIL